jgi:CRISPR-associated protein Csd1
MRDKQIEEILADLTEFPAHLSLDEQGLFAIGYYHQRQDFFKSKESHKDIQ